MTTEPALLARARRELGVHETPGPVSTARILDYRKMAELRLGGDDGQVPWCAIFVNAMLADLPLVGSKSAMARSFVHWGRSLDRPHAGAVVAMASATRPSPSGHVAIATGRYTATHVEVVGGNQGDAVSTAWFRRSLVLAYRWPSELAPPTGKPMLMAASGPVKQVADA